MATDDVEQNPDLSVVIRGPTVRSIRGGFFLGEEGYFDEGLGV